MNETITISAKEINWKYIDKGKYDVILVVKNDYFDAMYYNNKLKTKKKKDRRIFLSSPNSEYKVVFEMIQEQVGKKELKIGRIEVDE